MISRAHGIVAAVLALLSAAGTARSAGLLVTGGDTIRGASPSQGRGAFVAPGIFFEKPIFRRAWARLEIFPIQFYRQRERPIPEGAAGRETVLASAACLMARYDFVNRPGFVLFAESGAGPMYSYSRPVPSGGTRGNFFDQIGVGVRRGRLDFLVRFTHVSNLSLGSRGRDGNPGFSFETAGIAWKFP